MHPPWQWVPAESSLERCQGLQAPPPGARSTVTHLEHSGELSRSSYSTVNTSFERGPGAEWSARLCPVSGPSPEHGRQPCRQRDLLTQADSCPRSPRGSPRTAWGRGGQKGLPGLSQRTSPSTSGPWERGGRGGSSRGAGVEGTWVGAGLDVPPLGGKSGWAAPWASLSLNFRGCAAPPVHPAGSCLYEENVPEGTGQAGAVREASSLRSLLLTARGLESRAHHGLLSPHLWVRRLGSAVHLGGNPLPRSHCLQARRP